MYTLEYEFGDYKVNYCDVCKAISRHLAYLSASLDDKDYSKHWNELVDYYYDKFYDVAEEERDKVFEEYYCIVRDYFEDDAYDYYKRGGNY